MQGDYVGNRELNFSPNGREERREKVRKEGKWRGELRKEERKKEGKEGEKKRGREKPQVEGKDFIPHEQFYLFLYNEMKKNIYIK